MGIVQSSKVKMSLIKMLSTMLDCIRFCLTWLDQIKQRGYKPVHSKAPNLTSQKKILANQQKTSSYQHCFWSEEWIWKFGCQQNLPCCFLSGKSLNSHIQNQVFFQATFPASPTFDIPSLLWHPSNSEI